MRYPSFLFTDWMSKKSANTEHSIIYGNLFIFNQLNTSSRFRLLSLPEQGVPLGALSGPAE